MWCSSCLTAARPTAPVIRPSRAVTATKLSDSGSPCTKRGPARSNRPPVQIPSAIRRTGRKVDTREVRADRSSGTSAVCQDGRSPPAVRENAAALVLDWNWNGNRCPGTLRSGSLVDHGQVTAQNTPITRSAAPSAFPPVSTHSYVTGITASLVSYRHNQS